MRFPLKVLLFLIVLGCSQYGLGQKVHDSLINKSHEELMKLTRQYYPDSSKTATFMFARLKKSKREKDTIKLASSYYNLGLISPQRIHKKYLDSVILITKNLNDSRFPALALVDLGYIEYHSENYKAAFENYLSAYKLYEKHDNLNSDNALIIKIAMGALKSLGGDYLGGLQNAKEVFEIEKMILL